MDFKLKCNSSMLAKYPPLVFMLLPISDSFYDFKEYIYFFNQTPRISLAVWKFRDFDLILKSYKQQ